MISQLRLQNGVMVGSLSGKWVCCFLHSTGGSAPPPGEYVIRGPVQDPIYGPVAIMLSTRGGRARTVAKEIGASLPDQHAGTVAIEWTWEARSGVISGAFIVSGAVIPGRNCLRASIGMSELLEALQTAGSAVIRVG